MASIVASTTVMRAMPKSTSALTTKIAGVKDRRTKDVGRLSLVGHLVTPVQDKLRTPSFLSTVIGAMKLEWMTLGDDTNEARQQSVNEQANIGLVSALLGAVSIQYLIEVPGLNWELVAQIWDPFSNSTSVTAANAAFRGSTSALSGEAVADMHRNALSVLSFVATVCFALSTMHSVMTNLMLGELTGELEAYLWLDRLGMRARGGFCLCLLGILFLFTFISYHFFIFCSSWPVMVGGILLVLAFCGFYVFVIVIPQQQSLFAVKELSYQYAPRTLPPMDVAKHCRAFCAEMGAEQITPQLLVEFTVQRLQQPNEPPVVFAPATQQLLAAVAQRVTDKIVAQALAEGGELVGMLNEVTAQVRPPSPLTDTPPTLAA